MNELKDRVSPIEESHLAYLEKYNFEKTLKKMQHKMRNKKVVLYGAGMFFETINKHYDLSKFNIAAISDRKFKDHAPDETFLGYGVCAPEEIISLKPDYVLVSNLEFVNIVDFLTYDLLKNTKIKVKPLVTLPLLDLIKTIWES